MSFVIIAGDDYRIHRAQKFKVIAYTVGNAAGRAQFLRGFRILSPCVRYRPAIQSEFRCMPPPDIFVNTRPPGSRQSFGRVPVDDGAVRKRMPVPFAQSDDPERTSPDSPSAVDMEILSGDITPGIGAKQRNGTLEVIGLPNAVHWILGGPTVP